MRLFYRTGWPDAAVHYCPVGGGSWQTAPLVDAPGEPGWKMVLLTQAPDEFVMRNAAGTEWDNPSPGVGTKNYTTKGGPPDGVYTLVAGRVSLVAREAVLVVSDLDHTMIGHDNDPGDVLLEEFKTAWLRRYRFAGSRLVYSTGRNKSDALTVACEKGLLRPAFLVCGVGTEVYEVPQDLPDETWAKDPSRITLEPSWGAKMAAAFDRPGTAALLSTHFPRFDLKGNVETDPYRIPSGYEVDEQLQESLRLVREALGPMVQVIVSGGDEFKYVDFCSAEAGKMKACQFAMERLGFLAERTLVCGDSGNDESMYRCPLVRGVAVGNALPELVAALRGMANPSPETVQKGAIFTTRDGGRVLYAGRDTAGAIVEALEAFWPPQQSWAG